MLKEPFDTQGVLCHEDGTTISAVVMEKQMI